MVAMRLLAFLLVFVSLQVVLVENASPNWHGDDDDKSSARSFRMWDDSDDAAESSKSSKYLKRKKKGENGDFNQQVKSVIANYNDVTEWFLERYVSPLFQVFVGMFMGVVPNLKPYNDHPLVKEFPIASNDS